jgi:hypothetical protein
MMRYLTIGLGVTVAVIGFLLWESVKAQAKLEVKLVAADAVIKQKEADAKLNAIAVSQLAEKIASTETKVVTVTEKIYVAPKTTVCAEQPSVRLAIDGVRDLYGDSVRPPSGRQPQGTLQAAGAAGRASQR